MKLNKIKNINKYYDKLIRYELFYKTYIYKA